MYFKGRVLHRRTNHYSDLLPLTPDREQALKLRVDEQHREVVEEIRSGKLEFPEAKMATPVAPQESFATGHRLELLNAKTWLSGKRAFLQIVVHDQTQTAVEGAKVTARVEGAARPTAFCTETGPFGHAQFEFDMPPLAGPVVALVIESAKGAEQARRAKATIFGLENSIKVLTGELAGLRDPQLMDRLRPAEGIPNDHDYRPRRTARRVGGLHSERPAMRNGPRSRARGH